MHFAACRNPHRGITLIGLLLWGPGRWSLDRFVAPRLAAFGPYTRAA